MRARSRLISNIRHPLVQDVTKWQAVVKANREVATLSFPHRRDGAPRKNTTQAIVADFRPESALEAEVAALLEAAGAASGKDLASAEAMEMNTLSVDQVRERQARLAKMRSLLFYHEAKAKRLKAIKSKSFRKHEAARLKMAARKRGEEVGGGGGEEAEDARKAEFDRAQARRRRETQQPPLLLA